MLVFFDSQEIKEIIPKQISFELDNGSATFQDSELSTLISEKVLLELKDQYLSRFGLVEPRGQLFDASLYPKLLDTIKGGFDENNK